MSLNARREQRSNHRLCGCGRRALFVRPGRHEVAYRRDHPLCPGCWARVRDRFVAEQSGWRRAAVVWLPAPEVLAA